VIYVKKQVDLAFLFLVLALFLSSGMQPPCRRYEGRQKLNGEDEVLHLFSRSDPDRWISRTRADGQD
jgi:hypothetical protein